MRIKHTTNIYASNLASIVVPTKTVIIIPHAHICILIISVRLLVLIWLIQYKRRPYYYGCKM